MGGALGAAVLWAKTDIRARWRPLVALGLIAGVAAGLAIACLVGADRTGTALERLQERTHASDAVLFASQADEGEPDWSTLVTRPEVDALARWSLVFGDLAAEDNPGEELISLPPTTRSCRRSTVRSWSRGGCGIPRPPTSSWWPRASPAARASASATRSRSSRTPWTTWT